MMIADVNNLKELKMTVVRQFNHQLLSLQLGHIYKRNNVLTEAIDFIEYLEGCDVTDKHYDLISYYIDKLNSNYKY